MSTKSSGSSIMKDLIRRNAPYGWVWPGQRSQPSMRARGVFGHFGKTQKFKVYDIEDGKVVNSQILDTNGEGCGALAGILNINDVDALICGGIGGGAVNAIQEAGIKLYAGASGNTDAVVEALIAGTLDANGEANCDHHDHGHGEGHSCGHGSCH